jgi:branched-chain amino acid transport system substrate-binding protein
MLLRLIFGVFLLSTVVPAARAQQTFTIGVSESLSGRYSVMGNMQKKGFSLWERHVNDRGGISGKKVRMLIYDDHSEPARAKAIYRKMILEERVDLVFGPYSSGISEAILPVTEKHGYPVLLSGASADRLWEKGYKYAFGVYTPASKYAVGFLEMLAKNKLNNLSIVSADDAFSVVLSNRTRKWIKKFHLMVVLFERFKKGTKNLEEIAAKVKASEAQVLIVCGHLDESVHMRLALKNIGWFPKAYWASVGPATQKFHTILKRDAEHVFSSSQWEEEVGAHFPGGSLFIKSFKEIHRVGPSYHAATAYAAGMILEAALEKMQDFDRKGLRDVLSAMDTMTVIGRYGVDKSGMQIRHFPVIVQWQAGKKRVVWPKGFKLADPIFK